MSVTPERGSFRDPSGFVFTRNGVLLRQVNASFSTQFAAFVESGLCAELIEAGLLLPHETLDLSHAATGQAAAVLQPRRIDFISYPYEWCFAQLKDAALLTLELQRRALERGFVLRDASAYNVQFQDGRAVFIDTLSFEPWTEGEPWTAYRQFCEHFLAPLALMSRVDIRCARMLRTHLDGIPLDLAARMLPLGTRVSPTLLLHVHAHARAIRRHAHTVVSDGRSRRMKRESLLAFNQSLVSAVQSLTWRPQGTTWAGYTGDNNYSGQARDAKRHTVGTWLRLLRPRVTWDLGANTGEYSFLARETSDRVIAFDADPGAVELMYAAVRKNGTTGVLPLLMDLTNSSPAQGWNHEERMSLAERGPADLVMPLALVHHLAIANNTPLPRVADLLARVGRHAIVEFVPKSDSQVQRLLANRRMCFRSTHKMVSRARSARGSRYVTGVTWTTRSGCCICWSAEGSFPS